MGVFPIERVHIDAIEIKQTIKLNKSARAEEKKLHLLNTFRGFHLSLCNLLLFHLLMKCFNVLYVSQCLQMQKICKVPNDDKFSNGL